ncbi:MAG: hypothetical protein HZB41_10970 [Ignavibacteriae bacterium]|nr:hypothetical protein [Ignavibacteriota bacterium]
MELDDYISKYIDSELTDEEDVQLRKLLSEDDFARDKFDSAVTVHLAMKEDSQSIEPPEDIYRQTEDIVLMKILANQPIITERPLFWRRNQLLAAMIVFFILSFVFQIDDMYLGNLKSVPNNSLTSVQDDNQENTSAQSGRITHSGLRPAAPMPNSDDITLSDAAANGSGARSAGIIVSDEIGGSEEKKDGPMTSTQLQPAPPVTEHVLLYEKNEQLKPGSEINHSVVEKSRVTRIDGEIYSISDYNINEILVNKPVSETEIKGINYESMPLKTGEKTNITFSSFLGTDFVRTGFGEDEDLAITNFSQSIAYSIDSDEKMGIEIGYSEYAYKENVVLPSPLQSLSKVKSQLLETTELEMPIGVNWFESSITLERQRQFVWGSAFYERSLLSNSDVSLEGRLGLGMSYDGPLGYGRIFGKYNFLNGFAVTVGTEGRVFQVTLPGEKTGKKLKSTGTIIYGFQINF